LLQHKIVRRIAKQHINKYRGTRQANAQTIKNTYPQTFNNNSRRSISRALNKSDFKRHRRAPKSYRSKINKEQRKQWARAALRWKRARLNKMVFTDGATFYYPASKKQAHEKYRDVAGPTVIRQTHERLHADCVGSTGYVP
jgi:hypothetical protein